MPVFLVKATDFQIMNRFYSWKLQFLHVTECLQSLQNNKIPLVLPLLKVFHR